MAYVSQQDKARLSVGIKKVLKKYGVAGSLSVRHHSGLVCKLRKGVLDLRGDGDVNVYWIADHYKDQPVIKDFYMELVAAMKGEDFFDHSDIQSDYFNQSHYFYIEVVDNYKYEG